MKKNGKVIMLLVLLLAFAVLSWIIPAGTYSSGTFVSNGITPVGIFDLFIFVYYALSTKLGEVIYLLAIGGMYGVLSNTKSYRNLVTNISKSIKGNEHILMLVTTLLMGIFVSISADIIPVLIFVPFIVSIFLKSGRDRVSALAAAFGGIFIGLFGHTVGTFAMSEFNSTLKLALTDALGYKIVMFVISYVLFNIFAIMHMRKTKVVDETKYDMFAVEEVKTSKKKKQTSIAAIIFMVIIMLFLVLGYIDWYTSFNLSIFNDLHSSISNIEVGDTPIISNLLGSVTSFGSWNTLFFGTIIIAIVLVATLIDKMNFNVMFAHFQNGVRKMYKVAFIYVLAYCFYVLYYFFSWGITAFNWMVGTNFNPFIWLIVLFVAATLITDIATLGTVYVPFISANYIDSYIASSFVSQIGMSFAVLIAPTSYLLMVALSYLDVPYTSWLKYIWKFLVSMLVASLIVIAIMCYM